MVSAITKKDGMIKCARGILVKLVAAVLLMVGLHCQGSLHTSGVVLWARRTSGTSAAPTDVPPGWTLISKTAVESAYPFGEQALEQASICYSLSRLKSSGAVDWTQSWRIPEDHPVRLQSGDLIEWVSAEPSGSIALSDEDVSTGLPDIVLRRLTPSGDTMPFARIIGQGRRSIRQIQEAPDGTILVLGIVSKDLVINDEYVGKSVSGKGLGSPIEDDSVFIASLSPDGQYEWCQIIPTRFGSDGDARVALSSNGLVLATSFKGTLNVMLSTDEQVSLSSLRKGGVAAIGIHSDGGIQWVQRLATGWVTIDALVSLPDEYFMMHGSYLHSIHFVGHDGQTIHLPAGPDTKYFALFSADSLWNRLESKHHTQPMR